VLLFRVRKLYAELILSKENWVGLFPLIATSMGLMKCLKNIPALNVSLLPDRVHTSGRSYVRMLFYIHIPIDTGILVKINKIKRSHLTELVPVYRHAVSKPYKVC
jgi:hypothetical protein